MTANTFTDLPGEVRNQVYRYLFVDFEHRVFLRPYLPDRIEAQGIKNWISMTQVNRQIREDTKDFAPRQKTAISTNDLTSRWRKPNFRQLRRSALSLAPRIVLLEELTVEIDFDLQQLFRHPSGSGNPWLMQSKVRYSYIREAVESAQRVSEKALDDLIVEVRVNRELFDWENEGVLRS
jgi:hypothetical protein